MKTIKIETISASNLITE